MLLRAQQSVRVMKSLVLSGALACTIGMAPSTAGAATFEVPPEISHEINVTADSDPGWIPSADQRQRAMNGVEVFLDAIDGGRYAEAYGLMSDGNKAGLTLTQFSHDEQEFKARAGPAKFWRVLKITWTKDPEQGPAPGVYAAVDLTGQFANIDRDCGYVVMYQPPAGGDFSVARRENYYMDNATARSIEQRRSKAEVVRAWGELSRFCPNYVPTPDAR